MDFTWNALILVSAVILTSTTQGLHESCQSDGDCGAANATCVNATTHSYCECKADFMMTDNVTCTKVSWNGYAKFTYINDTTYNITWNAITPQSHTEPTFYYVQFRATFPSIAPSLYPCLNSTSIYCIAHDVIPFITYDYNIEATGPHSHHLGLISWQFKAKQTTPGIVNAITVRQGKYSYGEITAKWTMNDTQMHGPLTKFLVNVYTPGGTGVPLKTFDVLFENNGGYLSLYTSWQQIVFVDGNKMYSLGIKAVNNRQQIGPEVFTTFKTMIWYPPNAVDPTVVVGVSTNITESTFNIMVQRDFFLNNSYGPIIDYGLIVAKQYTYFGRFTRHSQGYFMTINSWALASNDNDFQPYRATPYKWDILKGMNKSDKYSPFTIGAGNCNKLFVKNVFCNGPLHAGLDYNVFGFACTSAGCTITKSYGPFSTKKDTTMSNTTVILVVTFSVLGGVFLSGLVGAYLSYRNQKKSRPIPMIRKY